MEEVLFWIKERKILCSLAFLGIVSVTFLSLYIMEVTAEEAYTCPVIENIENIEKEEPIEDVVIIDVKGAVVNPGVYRVNSNSIINDVLILAGGLTKDADTSNLNLSKKVSNEMVITVYTKEEIKNADKLDSVIETEKKDDTDTTVTSLVSINTGTLEELITLPGIGEAKAKTIIQYRDNCGAFKSIEELKNIKGIGEAMYEKIKDYITI